MWIRSRIRIILASRVLQATPFQGISSLIYGYFTGAIMGIRVVPDTDLAVYRAETENFEFCSQKNI